MGDRKPDELVPNATLHGDGLRKVHLRRDFTLCTHPSDDHARKRCGKKNIKKIRILRKQRQTVSYNSGFSRGNGAGF